MALAEDSLKLHESRKGKIEIRSKIQLKSRKDLSVSYTPGVAAVSSAIAQNKDLVYRYTIKHNTVAVISDGSAVLGLGDIGPEAALPVMEGKCLLMKELAGIDAFPICLDVHKSNEIVAAVKAIAPVFGAINLEDIAAPKCFEIESRLKKELNIPVMHDDQHATAVVVLAALVNALKVTGRDKNITAVINGAGAAGIAVAKMLMNFGISDLIMVDSTGAIFKGRKDLTEEKSEIASVTNHSGIKGKLDVVIKGADVFIGVSKANVLTPAMVGSMAKKAIVFAMANPVPEIMPDDAKKAGAAIVATGRSDFPNQVNNSLAFPGIFRGTLDSRASEINEEMKISAAYAIAGLVQKPTVDMIIPEPLDKRIVPAVSKAVVEAAIRTGVARK